MTKILSPLPENEFPNQISSEQDSVHKNLPAGVKSREKKKSGQEFYKFATKDFDQMNNIVFWNSLGFFLYTFLLRFATNKLLNASGTETGIIFAAQTFGGLLITPLVGYLTDRMSKKKLVLFGAIGRGFSYILLYFGLGINNLIFFGVGTFILGVAVVYFWTPLNALIAQKTYRTVRSTAFGKQAGMIGWGNLLGALFTLLYYYLMNTWFPNNPWILFLPLILFCGFNIFAGIRFYRHVDETIFFDDDLVAKSLPEQQNTQEKIIEEKELVPELTNKRSFYLGMGALLTAFMISAINQSIASPFLQIYITDTFFPMQDTYEVGISIMLIYLPSEVLAQLFAPKMGEIGDKINPQLGITVICGLGSLITWLLINLHSIYWFVVILLIDTSLAWANGLVLANLMSRISKNNRGKLFSARQWVSLLGAAIGPILGGLAWEFLNHYAPFRISIFVEMALIPLYWMAIKWLDPFMEEKLD